MFTHVFLHVLVQYLQTLHTLQSCLGLDIEPQFNLSFSSDNSQVTKAGHCFKNWWSDLETDKLILVNKEQHAKTQMWCFTLFLYYHIWIFLLFTQLKTLSVLRSLCPTFRPHGTAPSVCSSVFTSCISEPTFVSSSLDPSDGKLYFFFSEVGKEFSFVDELRIARVAQVCKVSVNTERSPRLQNVTIYIK